MRWVSIRDMQFPPTGVLTSKVSEANLLCLMMVVPEEASGCWKWIYMQKTWRTNSSGKRCIERRGWAPASLRIDHIKATAFKVMTVFMSKCSVSYFIVWHFVNQVENIQYAQARIAGESIFLEKLEIWIFRFSILDIGYCSYQYSWYGLFNTSLKIKVKPHGNRTLRYAEFYP